MSTPPEVERLRQKAKSVAWAADKQEHAEQPRTGVLYVNLELSRELFTYYIMYVECHESNLAICVLAIIQDIKNFRISLCCLLICLCSIIMQPK